MPQLVEFVSEAPVGPRPGAYDFPRRLDLNADGTYAATLIGRASCRERVSKQV